MNEHAHWARGKSAFLFDLDGTLVDSDRGHESAYRAVLGEHHPGALEHFDYDLLKGRPTREALRCLGVPETLAPLKQLHYRELVARGEVPLLAGAREVLEHLAARGHRLFVVTGASRAGAGAVLEAHRLKAHFEAIITAEDVTSGKPHPEPYLNCLRDCHLDVSRSLAIEDSQNGLQSALSAGLDVAYVQPGPPSPSACWNGPTLLHFFEEIRSYE